MLSGIKMSTLARFLGPFTWDSFSIFYSEVLSTLDVKVCALDAEGRTHSVPILLACVLLLGN